MHFGFLPAVNASLNGLSLVFLLLAFRAIRQKKIALHRKLMISAFVVSIVFLVLYVAHKWWLYSTTGNYNQTFGGEGVWRVIYFSILIPHVILAMTIPVLASLALIRGLKLEVEKHKKIVRYTFPIWVFVSVTGVIVYLMLYQWFPN